MRALVLSLVLLAPIFAGCFGASDVDPAHDVPSVFVDPITPQHDHASFEDHAIWTPSMRLVAHHPLGADGNPYSYIGEMDTHGDLAVVQILGRGSMPGFVLLDVSDPADPEVLGRADLPFSYVVDVKFSPDGQSVFAASQAGAQRTRGHQPVTDDPATALLTGNGFTQWDVSDPTNPRMVGGGIAEGSGCHMLSVQQLAGGLYVFCIAHAVLIFEYAGGGAWVQTGALRPDVGGAQHLVRESLGATTGAPNVLLLGGTPHDVTVQQDPLEEGRWLASVSYWDLGYMVYDVTDPRQPELLGAWAGEGAEVYEGNVHGAMLTEFEGKRVAVVGPELLGNTHPAMWVLDMSDLASPKLMAEWVPPGAHETQGLLLTVHQFQLVGGRIYLAYNHAGLWVLDLPTIVAGDHEDDPARPEVLGYYLPHMEVELYDANASVVPNVWDVNVKDGHIFITDRYTGFHVLHYEGDTLGDTARTSFG